MKKLITASLVMLTMTLQAQIETIRYIDLTRHITIVDGVPQGYIEVSAEFTLPLPQELAENEQVVKIAETYKSMYNINRIDTIGGVYYAVFRSEPTSMGLYRVVDGTTTQDMIDNVDIQNALEEEYQRYVVGFAAFQLFPFDDIIGKSKINGTWVDSQ
jgi:hypothetical protein